MIKRFIPLALNLIFFCGKNFSLATRAPRHEERKEHTLCVANINIGFGLSG